MASDRPTVLVDMDGCLVNLWDSIGDVMRRNGFLPIAEIDLKEWDIAKIYPDHVLQSEADRALNTFGTFFKAKPRDGAVEAMQDLASVYDVRIVTTPWAGNPYCTKEKIDWVLLNLGTQWVHRMIITYDKTLVRGDVLIDDKPDITGVMSPEWEHILFHQGYNAGVNRPRILHWDLARAVVGDVIQAKPLFIGNPDPERYRSDKMWVHKKRRPGDPVARFD